MVIHLPLLNRRTKLFTFCVHEIALTHLLLTICFFFPRLQMLIGRYRWHWPSACPFRPGSCWTARSWCGVPCRTRLAAVSRNSRQSNHLIRGWSDWLIDWQIGLKRHIVKLYYISNSYFKFEGFFSWNMVKLTLFSKPHFSKTLQQNQLIQQHTKVNRRSIPRQVVYVIGIQPHST